MSVRLSALFAVFACLWLTACGEDNGAKEAGPAAFYHGRTITITVGFSPGGGYDLLARTLAPYWAQEIPGRPQMIVQNIAGAASFGAANYVFGNAPRDGTAIAILVDTATIAPLMQFEGAHYDPRKIVWIGSVTKRGDAAIIVRTDAVKNIEEAREKEVILGSTGAHSVTSTYPHLVNEIVGTKFKVITGYPGGAEAWLAVERGELHGRAGIEWSTLKSERPRWTETNFVHPILQLSLKPHPELEGVPLVMDYVTNETDRQVLELVFGIHEFSRVFSMAPEVPPERVSALRQAFHAALHNPDFIRAASEIMPRMVEESTHEEIEAFVAKAYAYPDEVVERAARYVGAD